MTPQTTSQGTNQTPENELLWIPHDAGSMKYSPHKPTIFSHVQSNRHAQKRRAEAKALRASALTGRTSALRDPSLRSIAGKRVRPDRVRESSGTSQQERPDNETQAPRGYHETRKHLVGAVSPLSFVGKGNSDPFHAYSIAIGPEENGLLALYRDYVLPSMYHLRVKHKNFNDQNLSDLASRDWRDNVAGLQEKGTALGTLARFGAIAGRVDHGMQQVTLRFLGESTRILIEKILREQDLDNPVDCLHINMLFNTEIINQNVHGAVAHGKMFRYIFKSQWNQRRLDYKMLLYQLHNDLQLSSAFLTRPIFDVDNWLPEVLKPLWDAAAPYFPAFSGVEDDMEENMDPAIEHEVLVHWFKQRRRMMRYEGLSAEGVTVPPLPLVATSFMASSFLFHSRMINHYLDTQDELEHEELCDEVKSQLFARQCLALTAVQLRRWTGYAPQIMGVPIYDNDRFMNALKHALEQCEASSARANTEKYLNTMVWALYVGALVERGPVLERMPTSQQWFNSKLAELAIKAQVISWNSLKAILKRFLYEESLMSQGSVWFEEHIQSFKQREEVQRSVDNFEPGLP